MFRRHLHLLALTLLSAALPLSAQVHEGEAPVDLAKGLVLTADAASADATLAPAAETQPGQKAFAAALLVEFADPLKDSVLASQSDDRQGWRFLVTADGALRFEARTADKPDAITVTSQPGVIAPGSRHHLALNILREAGKPNAGLWVDGIEVASGVMPPVNLATSEPLRISGAKQVRLYHRELSRPEVIALHLEATASGKPGAKHPAPPANGPRFIPQQDETIALIGGTEAVALAESGELEALLLMAFPQTRFHFRSLAWEGDTVFKQDRPLNFGSLEQQLKRVNAGAVMMVFGRQECLDLGLAGVKDFEAALDRLIVQVKAHTANVIVASPPLFQPVIAEYTGRRVLTDEPTRALFECFKAMERLADKHGIIYAKSYMPAFLDGPSRSHDGVTLTSFGVHEFAISLARALGLKRISMEMDVEEEVLLKVLPTLQSKNRLWHDYWRPSNWAFLFGDRTQQPSSRDPVNPQLRILPAEQEKYLPLLKDAEEKVFKLVEEAAKRLP